MPDCELSTLTAEMHRVFDELTAAQTSIEPEFQEAFYSNRAEMYVLFDTQEPSQ